MQTIAMHREIQVAGIGVSVRSIGPAIAGSHHRAVVLAVTAADGSPRSGLTAADFSAQFLVRGASGITARTADAENIVEPLPGIYVLELVQATSARAHGAVACVIDIRDGKAGGRPIARAIVGLDS